MSTEPKTIVIVEDEPDTAEMFAEMMRLSGYQVQKSYGGSPAMTLIAQTQPDAVMLDLMMPDLSGMEVLNRIRRDSRLCATPVIIVSARSMPADIQAGLDAGASVYLTKPVSYSDLRDAVEKVIHPTGRES